MKCKVNMFKTILENIFPHILQNRFWNLKEPSDIPSVYPKTLYYQEHLCMWLAQRHSLKSRCESNASQHPWCLPTVPSTTEHLLITLDTKPSD